jgi:uncharacterized secreted protein with C-terminal beta-propeller domain
MGDKIDVKNLKESFENIQIPAELDITIEKAIQDGKRKKKKSYILKAAASAACIALAILSTCTYMKGIVNTSDKNNIANNSNISDDNKQSEAQVKSLPVVGSLTNLQSLISGTYQDMGTNKRDAGINYSAIEKSKSDEATNSNNLDGSNMDYSKTNNQVEGVDEPDTIKTDGEYIYKIAYRTNENDKQGVQIIKASPAQDMSLVKKLDITEFMPNQIFVKDNYLIVIGSMFKPSPVSANEGSDRYNLNIKGKASTGNWSTEICIYDMKDKNNINLIRNVEVDGSLTSARMIGNDIYTVSNKYISKALLDDTKYQQELLPLYRDSVIGKEALTIDYNSIKYCPEALEPNYILVSDINLGKLDEKVNVTAILGSGRNIFCSTDNLYIAGYNYKADKQYTTTIYKFNLKDNNISFTGSGNVPGNILNQFSMDEDKDYFRVTTTNILSENGNSSSVNNLYILDKDMKLTGKLEGLAKGERIYSTRFIGDRAYMVTYKNTDPLFVLDLKNPAEPKVLGELKIQGFSNYLQPYDENHLIGMGMDTQASGEAGKEIVRQKGMKLAVFDVSDVSKPKQQFMKTIGDRGTYSEALNNHKALLFSKDKNLLAFPVTVTEVTKDNIAKTTFVGAYVYNIDLTNGFTLKGSITHMSTLDPRSKSYNWNGMISRVLYIKDNLYTISENGVKANSIKDLKEVDYLRLK